MLSSLSWSRLAVILLFLVTRAEADPPGSNSGQGVFLHGTGRFEHVNIALLSFDPPPNLVTPPQSPPSPGTLTIAPRLGAVLTPERGTQHLLNRASPLNQLTLPPPTSSTCVSPDQWSMVLVRGEFKLVCTQATKKIVASGEKLVGTTFYAPFNGQIATFIIDKVSVDAAEPKFRYEVRWKTHGDWGYLCPQAVNHSSTKVNHPALAVPYAWSPSGSLIENPAYFTFVCPFEKVIRSSEPYSTLIGGGVIAKCISMGFTPWDTSANDNPLETASEKALRLKRRLRLHQLCTRMATADYCGEGWVNTIEGTPIVFFKPQNGGLTAEEVPLENGRLRAQLKDPLFSNYALESVWAVDPSGRARVICLGDKTRWRTLSLNGTCLGAGIPPMGTNDLAFASLLAGSAPLQSPDTAKMLASTCDKPPPTFIPTCERSSWSDLSVQEPLLITYSLFLDKPLARFAVRSPGSTTSFLTTARLRQEKSSTPQNEKWSVDLSKELQPDLPLPPGSSQEFLSMEGPILSSSLPPEAKKIYSVFNLKALYRCKKKLAPETAEYLYALTDDSKCTDLDAGYSLDDQATALRNDHGLEGYVFGTDLFEDKLELKLWKHDDGRYLTSTLGPERETGWHERKILGYLPTISAAQRAIESQSATRPNPVQR